ncbi:AbrB/MazE/SpoVT family DNA-binding domain-containing protein [Streptomyces sp. NPDC001178]
MRHSLRGPQNAAQRLGPKSGDRVALEPEPDHIAVRPDGSE